MNKILNKFNTPKITKIIILLFFLTCSLRFFYIAYKYSSNILFWDQWDFYNGIFSNKSWLTLFLSQLGPHRMGIGLIITKIIATISKWDTKYESYFISVLIIFATILALTLKKKIFSHFSIYDVVIPVIFLNLFQYESIIGTPDISLSALPLFLVILYCLSLGIKKVILKYAVILFINIIIIYSGFGLFLGFITPIIILLDLIKSKTKILIKISFLIISLISLCLFFVNYRFEPAADCFVFPHPLPLLYFDFMVRMVNSFLGFHDINISSYILFMVFVIVFLKIAIFLITSKSYNKYIPIFVLLLFSFIFLVFTAIGRVCMSPAQAHVSRYVTYLIPLYFGIYLYINTLKNKNLILSIFVFVIVFFSITNSENINPGLQFYSKKEAWKKCYIKYEDIEKCNIVTDSKIYPQPSATKLQWKLNYLKEHKLNLYKESK